MEAFLIVVALVVLRLVFAAITKRRTNGPMNLTITSVDYAPEELYDQVPIRARLTREIAGDDRPDYWVGELDRPITWNKDGTKRAVTHIVVAARWVGTRILKGADLPVGISFIVDPSQVTSERLDMKKVSYVAIGMASVR
jgi:hypothetical protein